MKEIRAKTATRTELEDLLHERVRWTWVTLVVCALNVLVFAVMTLAGDSPVEPLLAAQPENEEWARSLKEAGHVPAVTADDER